MKMEVNSGRERKEAVHARFATDFLRWRTMSIKAIKRSEFIYARIEETRSQKFVAVKRGTSA